ncbi:bifunctional biotin--[acetyl-CoA-carboxylase] ligase/biotin operon repressor BirA [Methylocucumis oryzae]|nr:bifunctional biotin--[acetyl-CoA-carboxylase] ligase/biotin operon repressor BirA [Methylocucumis oryzae]
MLLAEKQQQILMLLADGQFHSGTDLAKRLTISRAAVWKHVQALIALGLNFSAVTGKGYRLERGLELLSEPAILSNMSLFARAHLAALELHSQLDSTNRYLLAAASAKAPSGTVCMAEYQTAGRGRRGRQWVSPFGSNIYLSLLWHFQLGYAGAAGLSLAIGVAVIRALSALNITGVGLKWPNDIYCQGKKLGGILIEMAGESDGPCVSVVGLGLNCFLSESYAQTIEQPWTDLSKITGGQFVGRNRLAAGLISHLLSVLAEFEGCGIRHYIDEWRRYDVMHNRHAQLMIAEQAYTGIIRGIDDNGLLLFEHHDGRIQAYASGEVSFSGRDG